MDNIIELCKIGDLNGLIQLEKELGMRFNELLHSDNIIDNINYTEQSPIFTALINGHLNIVKYFVSKGYNINVLQNNSNILYRVIFNENKLNKEQLFEILNYLINYLHFDINKRDICGNTLLHFAILNNKINSTNILLDMGINKYYQNQYSEVAFDLAPNDEILEQIDNKHITEYLEYVTTI
jgi:ankyrin repeat protein